MKHTRKEKGESNTNTRGMTSETFPFFVTLLIVALIAVVLIQNIGNIGLVSRGAIRGTTDQLSISSVPNATIPSVRPPAAESGFTLQFASNLPSFDSPNGRISNDLPALNTLQLYAAGLLPLQSIVSAQVSIDGKFVSDDFTWDSSARLLTFPDVPQSDAGLSEGFHAYSFHVQTRNSTSGSTTAFDFGQTIQIDRTPPIVKSMKLTAGQKLAFTVQDPTVSGTPGAGLDYWNAKERIDTLNVALIHVETESAAASPFPYSLETGLPNALECARTNSNSDAELTCTYLFLSTLSSNEIPVVFATDDAGNRTVRPLTGDYAIDYSESIQANLMAAASTGTLSSKENEKALNLLAGNGVVFDLYVFHLDSSAPTSEQSGAGWTLQGKILNTLDSVDASKSFWNSRLDLSYPGHAPNFSVGKVVAIIPENMVVAPETQALIDQTIRVPNSAFPNLPWTCGFQAGGIQLEDYCIQRINSCTFIGCSGMLPSSWGVRRVLGTYESDALVSPKEPTHIPIVVTDYASNNSNWPTNSDTAGVSELVHGVVYLNYAKHISSGTHHFMPINYQITLAHELGHIFGLGHSDYSDNLMYGGLEAQIGIQLNTVQAARVQAGLARDSFMSVALGQWYPSTPAPTPVFTGCGYPAGNNGLSPSPRTLDRFSTKLEDAEAPYSGKPANASQVRVQGVKKYYCPLLIDGQQRIIQPAPEAVDATNAQAMLAQYPGAVIKKVNPPLCDCVRDDELAGNGTEPNPTGGGVGPFTGGGGGGGGPKTREPKNTPTNCGKNVPGYTLPNGSGETYTVSCPNESCPALSNGPDLPTTPQKCQVTVGAGACGDRSFVEIENKHYCCKCRPVATPNPEPAAPSVPGQAAPV